MPKEIYIDENGNERILSSSPSALSGLIDTDITTPSANQVLAYNGSKWGNVAPPTVTDYIKIDTATLTTNSNGFCNITLTGRRIIIISAWSSSGDVLIVPFSTSGANQQGAGQWWFRVHNDSMQIRANFNFTLYYAYIETT